MKKKIIMFFGILFLLAVAVYAASEAPNMRTCTKDCRETKLAERKACSLEYKESGSECRSAYKSCHASAKEDYALYKSSSDTAVNKEAYKENKILCRESYKSCFKEAISAKKSCYELVSKNDLECKSSCKAVIKNESNSSSKDNNTDEDNNTSSSSCPDKETCRPDYTTCLEQAKTDRELYKESSSTVENNKAYSENKKTCAENYKICKQCK